MVALIIALKNKIIWDNSIKEGVQSYNIYREDLLGFNIIGTRGVNQLSEFIDLSSNPKSKSYRYNISIIDSCGVEWGQNNRIHETIHLQANQKNFDE